MGEMLPYGEMWANNDHFFAIPYPMSLFGLPLMYCV